MGMPGCLRGRNRHRPDPVADSEETRPFREATVPIVWYATGEWNDGQLKPETTRRLDYGDRLYAPQSYWAADGRRIQLGWIRTDLDPAPVGDSLGVMSAPRELELGEDGQLRATPARELQVLRDAAIVVPISPGDTSTTVELPGSSNAVEVAVDESDAAIAAIRLVDDRSGAAFVADLTKLPRNPTTTAAPNRSFRPWHRRGLSGGHARDLDRPDPRERHPHRHRPLTVARTPDVTCWPLRPVRASSCRLTGTASRAWSSSAFVW